MSKVSGVQYSIGSPTRTCAATGRSIVPGEKFVAALTQSLDTSEFVRLDYSEQAWALGEKGGARPRRPLVLLGYWRAVAVEGEHKRRLLIDDEALIDLFDQTEDAQDKPRQVFRLVLALILLRKRLLTQEGSRGTTMLVRQRGIPRPPEGPALREVIDPGLDDESIAGVTEQLAAVLSGDDLAPATPAGGGGQ